MYKPLYKDMNRSELLSMRESGMSNREIAESLSVSYQTIRRMIGTQPAEMTAANRALSARNARTGVGTMRHVRPAPEPDMIPASLNVIRASMVLEGKVWDYRYKPGTEEIQIIPDAGITLTLPISSIPDLITELQAIERNKAKITAPTPFEVW